MKILPDIKSPADVKRLPESDVGTLCSELREAIIGAVSQNGGHLASNLGAVELTVALHRVYDPERDRIVFDVGHQCYAHKMLTGRLDRFGELRRLGGLSGFPKPGESAADACVAGHASTSISNALGMARARTIQGGDYDVAAIIGDGALTGGLAYEGLADCGESGEAIVVVLNDNGMSINSNVGGMARLLSAQRVKPSYIAIKKLYHRTVGRFEPIYRVLHVVKEWVKDLFLPDNMFEDMGFYYLGPIDGHDEKTLERTLRYARDMRRPVLVHIKTEKGRGYAPAEAEPEKYHGVSPFDPEMGAALSKKHDFSAVFGQELLRLAQEDGRIVAVTAAMESGTGLHDFAQKLPERFFDVGIAEEHAVSMCAGMAQQGLKPVFAVYSSFLQRAYDMLIHDVSLSGLPVVLGVDRAGLVGADGETHQGVFDVCFLSSVPGMRIFAPSSFAETRSMLREALDGSSPAAVRYPRGGEGLFRGDRSAGREVIMRPGADVTIVSYGILINEALYAADELEKANISAEVIKLNRLDGDDFSLCLRSLARTRRLIAVEEVCASGCLGERLLAACAAAGTELKHSALLNLGSGIVPQGEVGELREKYGVDAGAVCAAACGFMEEADEKGKA